jgi:hypothetical protein
MWLFCSFLNLHGYLEHTKEPSTYAFFDPSDITSFIYRDTSCVKPTRPRRILKEVINSYALNTFARNVRVQGLLILLLDQITRRPSLELRDEQLCLAHVYVSQTMLIPEVPRDLYGGDS